MAQVYTVNDKRELETVVVSPVVEVYYYSAKEKLLNSHKKCSDKLEEIKRQVLNCTSLVRNLFYYLHVSCYGPYGLQVVYICALQDGR